MLKIIMLCNGQMIAGLQDDNDHVRLVRIKDPLLFRYEKKNDVWCMVFQPYDAVSKPREVRFRIDAMYPANDAQTRQYEKARNEIFPPEKKDGPKL